MANSDYTIRANTSGFCPSAALQFSIGHLDSTLTMTGYTSPIPSGIRIGMAAMIDDEIVSVLGLSGNVVTLGRGCCDTVPASHSAGSTIWFFDDSFGNDGIEYGATETISVKLLPRTFSGGSVPIENAPPNEITFDWRFFRPYPPGLLRVNGDPWFNSKVLTQSGVTALNLTWKHRDRVTQQDALIDHLQSDVGPEPGTTYRVDVRKADNTLVHSTAAISGTSWSRSRASLIADFAVTGGLHNGYINVTSVREGYDSYQNYRIDFVLNASNPVSADLGLSYSVQTSDPDFASVVMLLKFEGTNGSTSVTDSSSYADNKTANTDQAISTLDKRYGTSSLRVTAVAPDGIAWTGSRFARPSGTALTAEGWIKVSSAFNGSEAPPIFRLEGNVNQMLQVSKSTSTPGRLSIRYDLNTPFDVDCTPDVDGWVHWAVAVQADNVARVFLQGQVVDTGTWSSTSSGATCGVKVAGSSAGSFNSMSAFLDDMRLTMGVCRYTSAFTPPLDMPTS